MLNSLLNRFTQKIQADDYIAVISPFDLDNLNYQLDVGYAHLTNPFTYYQRLIEELIKIDNLQIVPLYELQEKETNNSRLLGLRHDIDGDIVTAIRTARYLARVGVIGSFYILHTAPYYGSFINGVFVRNPQLIKWVQAFIVAGCELGVHNDAFGVYLFHQKNGAEALRQEIEWLRSIGANIRGTVAHNSIPVYGAENFEIFKERVLWNRRALSSNKKRLPLGILSEKELNLTYEGTFSKPKNNMNLEVANEFINNRKNASVTSEDWMRKLLLEGLYREYSIDFQFWLIGKDLWVMAGHYEGKDYFEWGIKFFQVLELLNKQLPINSRSLMVVHPCYIRK